MLFKKVPIFLSPPFLFAYNFLTNVMIAIITRIINEWIKIILETSHNREKISFLCIDSTVTLFTKRSFWPLGCVRLKVSRSVRPPTSIHEDLLWFTPDSYFVKQIQLFDEAYQFIWGKILQILGQEWVFAKPDSTRGWQAQSLLSYHPLNRDSRLYFPTVQMIVTYKQTCQTAYLITLNTW